MNVEAAPTDPPAPSASNDAANGVANASTSPSEPGHVPPPEASPALNAPPESSQTVKDKTEEAEKPKESDKDGEEKDKADKDRVSTSSHTHTRTHSTRRKGTKSASEIAHTASTLAAEEPRAAKKAKPSFIAKLFRVLVPCVGSTSRAHDLDLDAKPKQRPSPQRISTPPGQKEKEKAVEKPPVEKAAEPAPSPSSAPEPPVPAPSDAAHAVPSEPSTSLQIKIGRAHV